ncbi:TIGR02444 family protein [Pelagibius sp.]|uniref:TIGR02444 family protein n=1 Tax=Pelagibius sp. TaxID=1931238 RepID=UPI0026274018|nr:TIGR02444 family protein [Pelagibius sp.]
MTTAAHGAVPENPFWDFSLEAYERMGVAEACLGLQDRYGIDVNLLLFAAWAGSCGRALTGNEMAAMIAAAAAWQVEVVRPLRGVRRWLKQQDQVPEALGEELRGQVKALELQAEMLEQLLLHEELRVDPADPDPRLAAANMRLYLASFAPRPSDADLADLAVILRGSCPEVTPLEAIWFLGEKN